MKELTGHELSADGKTCVTLYEPTTIVEKFLPSTNQVNHQRLLQSHDATAGVACNTIIIKKCKTYNQKSYGLLQKKLGKLLNYLPVQKLKQTNIVRRKVFHQLRKRINYENRN